MNSNLFLLGFSIANTILLVLILLCVCVFGFLLLDRTKMGQQVLSQLDSIESYVSMMMADTPVPNPNQMYHSMDGKHSARSLEELIEKMMSDPDENFTEADAEELRKKFENIQFNDLDDEDEEDTWKKKS